jgi:hypothetical protein
MDFDAPARRKPDIIYAILFTVLNFHSRTVGPDIQLISGIAGNTQPNPAIT